MKVNWLKLIVSIIICELAGIIGSLATMPNIPTWYASINKHVFNPPNWIFGPVWTTLFALMGISLYLVWEKGFKNKNIKLGIYAFSAQFALNIVWSFLFFGLHNTLAAFTEIIFLWIAIFATIFLFYKIDKKAAYVLIPYICWVTFAAFLNYNVWILNV